MAFGKGTEWTIQALRLLIDIPRLFNIRVKTSRKMRNEKVGVRSPCRLSGSVILPILGSIPNSAYTMVWLVGFIFSCRLSPAAVPNIGRASDTDHCI